MARWIAIVWLILGLITATQVVVGMGAAGIPIFRWTLFWNTIIGWSWLACAVPGILWLSRRFPLGRGHWRNLAPHVAAALAVSLVHAVWTAFLNWAFPPLHYGRSTYWSQFLVAMYGRFNTGLIVYAATMVIATILESVRRLAQREADSARLAEELSKAQLNALRRQLEPHFLFNTMNGIAGLLRENRNEEAAAMLSGLSDLLQRVLNDSGRQLVPLGEEVEFLESYLNIQRMRFGDRLRVTLNAPDELLSAQIPPLILQPLVENAIVHGVGRRIEGGRISVTVKEDKGTLSLSVANDGPPLNAYTPGVGVSNTRRRLERLYGHDYGFDLRNRDADSVEAVIRVPYRTVTS